MSNVSPLEGIWIALNLVTLVLTVTALAGARADREAVRLLNGQAREIAASGIVRREALRVTKQLILLSIALPGLYFADGEVRPDLLRVFPIVALMSLAVLLLFQSLTDARERQRLTVLVTANVVAASDKAFASLREDLAENTRISQQASDHADRAYHEANSVNEKLAVQREALTEQGDALAAQGDALISQGEERASSSAEIKATVDRTEEKVDDLHEGTAPRREP